jgi:hypothetical protein
MEISEDGLLKTPKNLWGDYFFDEFYDTKEEAIADYQKGIDSNMPCPWNIILCEEFRQDYIFVEDT